MPLTRKQQKAVNRAPNNQKQQLITHFNLTNGANNSGNNRNYNNRRGNVRGRFSNKRGAPTNRGGRISQQTSFRRVNAPVASGSVLEKRESSNILIEKSFYASNFVTQANTPFSISHFTISPLNIPWIKDLAILYSKFKFLTFQYRFVSASPTTQAGSHWTAILPSGRTPPDSVSLELAQGFSQFHMGPVWKTDNQFRNFPAAILNDRWFTISALSNDQETSPGAVLFGLHLNEGNEVFIGYLEVKIRLVFKDPIESSGTVIVPVPPKEPEREPDQHQSFMKGFIDAYRALHTVSNNHTVATSLICDALECVEKNAFGTPNEAHRAAALEMIASLEEECKASGTDHFNDISALIQHMKDNHPKDVVPETMEEMVARLISLHLESADIESIED